MIKRAIKKVLLLILAFGVFVNLIPTANAQAGGVPILLYHNISGDGEQIENPMLTTNHNRFREHMEAIINAGYTPIDYQQHYNYVTYGESLPNKPIIITFDDGYLSNYIYAYPILKELNIKATIFIITGRMAAKNTVYPHFSWFQARDMVESGIIDIQSHTHTHPDLATISHRQLNLEMRISKALIEKYIGRPCNVIAFPYGSANADVFWAASEAGYKILNIVGDSGVNRVGDGLGGLKRLTVNGNFSGDQVLEMIEYNMER